MPSPFNAAILLSVICCACAWHFAGIRLLRAAAECPKGAPGRAAFLALHRAAWTGVVLLLAAAALSVANVVIAIPISLAALAAVVAQISAAVLASLTHKIPGDDPARQPARAAFTAITLVGMALPVLILLMAAAMIAPNIGQPGA